MNTATNLIKTTANRKPKKTKEFRIQAKTLLLTYSQINPEDASPKKLLDFLSKLVSIKEYLISKELHKDGNPHIHALIRLKRKIDIKNCHFFDYKDTHGNYERVRSYQAATTYLLKDGDYITNRPLILNEDGTQQISIEEYLLHKAKSEGIENALRNYVELTPKDAIKRYTTVEKNLRKAIQITEPIKQNENKLPDLNLPNFTIINNTDFLWWLKEGYKKTTLGLIGKAGLGKTQLAKAICNHYWQENGDTSKEKYVMISNADGLRFINGNQTGIIYDDPDFGQKANKYQIVHLYDVLETKIVRILHGSMKKPAGLIQVASANYVQQLTRSLPDQILRRLFIIEVDENIIKNNNNYTQTTNNINYTNITNNINININLPSTESTENNGKIWQTVKDSIQACTKELNDKQIIEHNRNILLRRRDQDLLENKETKLKEAQSHMQPNWIISG